MTVPKLSSEKNKNHFKIHLPFSPEYLIFGNCIYTHKCTHKHMCTCMCTRVHAHTHTPWIYISIFPRVYIQINSRSPLTIGRYNQDVYPGGWHLTVPNKACSNIWTKNFQMFKLVLEKAEEPEIKLPTSAGSLKKQESSRKTSISALLTMPKPSTVLITINCRKFWRRWEYQTTRLASWETCMQVRKQQLELDMDQQTGSK